MVAQMVFYETGMVLVWLQNSMFMLREIFIFKDSFLLRKKFIFSGSLFQRHFNIQRHFWIH